MGLNYEKYPIVLEWCNDTKWNILSDDSYAINGYTLSIIEELSWKIRNRKYLTQSTMEFEMRELEKN